MSLCSQLRSIATLEAEAATAVEEDEDDCRVRDEEGATRQRRAAEHCNESRAQE